MASRVDLSRHLTTKGMYEGMIGGAAENLSSPNSTAKVCKEAEQSLLGLLQLPSPPELTTFLRAKIYYALFKNVSKSPDRARHYGEQCIELCKILLQELHDSPNAPVGEEGQQWNWASSTKSLVGVLLYEMDEEGKKYAREAEKQKNQPSQKGQWMEHLQTSAIEGGSSSATQYVDFGSHGSVVAQYQSMNYPQQGYGSTLAQGSHGHGYSSIPGQSSGYAQHFSQIYGGCNGSLSGQIQDDVSYTVTKITKNGDRIQLFGQQHSQQPKYRSPFQNFALPPAQLSQPEIDKPGQLQGTRNDEKSKAKARGTTLNYKIVQLNDTSNVSENYSSYAVQIPTSRASQQPRPAGRFFEQKVQSGDAYVVHQVMAALIDAGYGPNSDWGEMGMVENKVEASGEDVSAEDEDVNMKHD